MLLADFVGDADPRQAHELGERRVRPARSARECGNETSHRRVVVTIECAQVDRVDCSVSRASYPREPIAGFDGGADRGRKDHGRA